MGVYTSIDKVKTILRSSTGKKVRFSSNSLKKVAILDDRNRVLTTNLNFKSESVTVDDGFVGELTLRFVFTSPTEFQVYQQTSEGSTGKVLVGSGDISSSFVYEEIQVDDAAFSGTITAGDQVVITFFADISDDMAEMYICDAELSIDLTLSELFHKYRSPEDVYARIYEAGSVPPEICYAAKYLASYFIYTDTFATIEKDTASNTYSFTSRWKKRAMDMVERYVKVQNRTAPFVAGPPIKIERFGVDNIASGLEKINTSYKEMTEVDTKDEEIFGEDC